MVKFPNYGTLLMDNSLYCVEIKVLMVRILIVFIGFVCASTYLAGQITYSVSDGENAPVIVVTGASTLHGWKAEAGEISEYPNSLTLDLTKESVIENFGFSVSVESLDGGRGSAMNDKIFKAFNSKENPQIEFLQSGPLSIPKVVEGEKVMVNVPGTISMAGQSGEISIPLEVELKEGSLKFSGVYALKMSDYGITPPSAMFGQIVTEDDIEVQYTFYYLKG